MSYIVTKMKNSSDQEREAQLKRLALGTATVIGVAYTNGKGMDETLGGTMRQKHWLGKAIGDVTYPHRVQFPQANFQLTHNEVTTSLDYNSNTPVTLTDGDFAITATNIPTGTNDLTLQIGAWSVADDEEINALHAFAMELPIYETNALSNGMYNKLFTYLDNKEFYSKFYYRDFVGDELQVDFSLEEPEAIKLKRVTLWQGPLTMAREYEHGVVLINPSHSPQMFDLANMYLGQSFEYLDGEFDTTIHTGLPAGTQVVVPELDAIFLHKVSPN